MDKKGNSQRNVTQERAGQPSRPNPSPPETDAALALTAPFAICNDQATLAVVSKKILTRLGGLAFVIDLADDFEALRMFHLDIEDEYNRSILAEMEEEGWVFSPSSSPSSPRWPPRGFTIDSDGHWHDDWDSDGNLGW